VTSTLPSEVQEKRVPRSFDRRRFLAGLGAAALVTPPLLGARAAAAAPRKGVLMFYVGGGIDDVNWYQRGRKTGPMDAQPLTGSLSAFNDKWLSLRKKLTVVEGGYGFWTKNGRNENLFSHQASSERALTCTHLDDGKEGLSLDRRLAEHLAGAQKVPFPSLHLTVGRAWGYTGRGEPSRNGSASLSLMMRDPVAAYTRVFMGVASGARPGEDAAADTRKSLEQGILAGALEQCRLVATETERQMGAEAARKVVDHCDSLRDMERRLEALVRPAECSVPKAFTVENKAANFHKVLDAWRAVAVNALACGLTNVVLLELWRDQPDFPSVFLSPQYHKLLIHQWHFHDNGRVGVAARIELDNLMVNEYAKVVADMDALRILDPGLAMWLTNEPRGDHSMNGYLPFFYAGSLGGKLQSGRYVRLAEPQNWTRSTVEPSMNEVYVAVMRAAGMQVSHHGPEKYHKTGSTVANALLT
jgi:hypothetical protein